MSTVVSSLSQWVGNRRQSPRQCSGFAILENVGRGGAGCGVNGDVAGAGVNGNVGGGGNGVGVSGGGVGQCCCLVPQVSVSTAAGGWWCNCWAIPDYPALEPLSDCRLKFVTELWVRIRMIAVVKYEKEIFDQMWWHMERGFNLGKAFLNWFILDVRFRVFGFGIL